MAVTITVRDAREEDFSAITKIYAYHVRNGTGSFEIDPPDEREMKRRWREVVARPAPYLVAHNEVGTVMGYCYAGYYNRREAYARSFEDSVYVAQSARGHGVGTLLMEKLLERCRDLGFAKMISVIGDSQNVASIGLHRKIGCREVGVVHECGEKFGRLLDIVIMELDLNKGKTK